MEMNLNSFKMSECWSEFKKLCNDRSKKLEPFFIYSLQHFSVSLSYHKCINLRGCHHQEADFVLHQLYSYTD